MKKKIILLVFLVLLLTAAVLTGIYWDPILDWLPIDQSGWNVTENRGICYLDEDGDPLTGWQTLDSEIYYFDPATSAMQIRWQDIGGSRYYLGDDGVRRTGWQTIAGSRYYLGTDGVMVTGWQTIEGNRYYMDADGAVYSGWLEDAGTRYYLNTDGILHTGWLEQPEGTYYLNENGNPCTGWLELDGNTYYLDETGLVEIDFAKPAPFRPGFVHVEGYLYYVQENGEFLKNGNVGLLNFNEKGRYTSGDEALDGYVATLIDGFIEANPDKDSLGLLRVAYDHCINGAFKYLKGNIYKKGHTGWEVADAKSMFEKGRGNCYNFAAAFWALARGLGYEAHGLAGYVTTLVQPHGWVLIEIGGVDYFFDPELHYDYIYDKREVKDMFMLAVEDSDWWYYEWTPVKKGA